ncbi:IS1106 transposase [Neisseria meningitidis]|nr:IS1106 transposase [Neisseria meningitidis]
MAAAGQWHSLSDPELEHSLITRIDFNLKPFFSISFRADRPGFPLSWE